MIIKEILEENPTLEKQYSDLSVMIQKVGTEEIYAEAIDPIECHRQYVETDIPIEEPEPEPEPPQAPVEQ